MTWLVWRQHRAAATFTAALLAVFGVVLLITGVHMADLFRTATTACRANDTCDQLSLFQGYGALEASVALTLAVPLLLGLFWGGPLLAREWETGTITLAWTQSVSRRRWLRVKISTLIIATIGCAAAVAGVVTWWSDPVNSLGGDRFEPSHFEIQGIVPIGYALFAVCLGILAGAALRRTVPALAVTAFVFGAVRIAVDNYLRPHFMAPVVTMSRLDQSDAIRSGSWILGRSLTLHGHTVPNGPAPARCVGATDRSAMDTCLSNLGYRITSRVQPPSRYWPFQLIETGLFVGLAAVLLVAAIVLVRRRDA